VQPRDVLTRPGRSPDIVYRYGSYSDQLIDVHLPPRRLDSNARAPVVILLHGGFWRQEFDRTHTRPMAEALSAAGNVVATPEYRRTGGDGGYPITLDDVAAAVTAVNEVETIASGRADLADVTLVGHSAGGHLAMWVALQPGAPPIRKVVALAPVADLVDGYERDLDDGAVGVLMGGSPSDLPAAYAAANPAAMLPGSVAITVVHGVLDDSVPISMSRSLRGVQLVELPGVEHYALIDPVSPAFGAVRDALR
jgi:acetyl esterase/lipase